MTSEINKRIAKDAPLPSVADPIRQPVYRQGYAGSAWCVSEFSFFCWFMPVLVKIGSFSDLL